MKDTYIFIEQEEAMYDGDLYSVFINEDNTGYDVVNIVTDVVEYSDTKLPSAVSMAKGLERSMKKLMVEGDAD